MHSRLSMGALLSFVCAPSARHLYAIYAPLHAIARCLRAMRDKKERSGRRANSGARMRHPLAEVRRNAHRRLFLFTRITDPRNASVLITDHNHIPILYKVHGWTLYTKGGAGGAGSGARMRQPLAFSQCALVVPKVQGWALGTRKRAQRASRFRFL